MKISIFIFLILVIVGCMDIFKSDPKPREIWIFVLHKDNPFIKPDTLKYEIIAVKNGYVQYKDLRWNEIKSENLNWFKTGSEYWEKGTNEYMFRRENEIK